MLFVFLSLLIALIAWITPTWAQTDQTAISTSHVESATAASVSSATAPNVSSANAPPSLEFQSGPASGAPATSRVATAKAEWRGLKADIKTAAAIIAKLTSVQRQKWDQAVAALPGFCHAWENFLHDREADNLAHLNWQERDGYETASYTGYGKVQACEAKESDEGIPIGKVTYDERSYYLVGKTVDEAKTHPRLIGTTSTLEIFSWENDRWFY
jgi:hypothetical protein